MVALADLWLVMSLAFLDYLESLISFVPSEVSSLEMRVASYPTRLVVLFLAHLLFLG